MHMQRSFSRWITTAAFFALAVFFTAAPAAQAQEAGYISQEAILAQMPEMQEAQQQLQQEIQAERKELQSQQQQLQEKFQKYQKQSEMLSEQSRQEREQQLREQQQQLQQSMQERDQEIAQRERELLRPVFEKFQSAVDAVASERELNFVIRDQALLYVDDTEMVDITEAVASRLGVEVQTQPGASVEPDTGQ